MYSLTSNSIKHDLLETNDVKLEFISELTPYNINGTSTPVDNNFLDLGNIETFKNKYDLLLLCFYFIEPIYGPNKVVTSELYPFELFEGAPIETNYKTQGFMSAEYISADSVTRGTCLRYGLYLLKTGTNRVLVQATHDDIKGKLYGIKL